MQDTGRPFIPCPGCGSPLPEAHYNTGRLDPCPSCAALVQTEVFPAFYQPVPRGQTGERIVVEGEASCYNHPEKRALTHCEACGRFLCALCDMHLDGQHLCPDCLETGRRTGRLYTLQNHRFLYDRAAFLVALLPLLIWPVTLVTAPVAMGLAFYGWKKPRSLVNPTRVWAWLAIGTALLELLAWAAFLSRLFAAFASLATGGISL